ncbi:MAG: hypothetical protein LQ351_004984 [Letrouitia transgressa]|nr:MAG: hypothetical protein LQ351_004984 [Letrouitia transgressa]
MVELIQPFRFTMKLKSIALTILPALTKAYRGDMTHYTPGLGSCGYTNGPQDFVVALSVSMMANPPNPNNNPKCGTYIDIFNEAKGTHQRAMIVDTCWGCGEQDIDVSDSLFYAVAPDGDGRVHGIEWSGDAVGGLVVQGVRQGESGSEL